MAKNVKNSKSTDCFNSVGDSSTRHTGKDDPSSTGTSTRNTASDKAKDCSR